MRTTGATTPRPQLPPQLYVDSRTPIKPLELVAPKVILREGGERP